ncbi:X-linked retinitis pigmentosa GTPase regulator-interacting protein 1 [Dromaius novaehollandiae]|uniref:X-linked retinitis pigmentosa GTPase regulator-interacting protein 1 n=1 Tax=Dromaius novaehollandiae TaxID=8790 RepID=UPI00311EBE86
MPWPLLDETSGELPVRDTDPVAEQATQPRSRGEPGEHLQCRREQMERWERPPSPAAVPRALAARRPGPSSQLELAKALEELRGRAGELERRNRGLRQRLLAYQQQLQLRRCHRYGRLWPLRRGSRKHRPGEARRAATLSRRASPSGPAGTLPTRGAAAGTPEPALAARAACRAPAGHRVAEEVRPRAERPTRGAGFAEQQPPRLQHGSEAEQQCQLRRAAIRSNVELIRLQRLLQERGVELAGARAHLGSLRQVYERRLRQHQEMGRAAGDALLARVEELAGRLVKETRRAAALEQRLPRLRGLWRALEEFQERVGELEQERDLLKEDYDELLRSSLRHGEPPPPPAETPAEKQLPVALEQEPAARTPPPPPPPASVAWCEVTEQRPNRMVPGSTEREERQQVPGTPEPPHAPGPDEPLALRRKVRETEAAHAETVLELEKTRDMLILQHRINRDYQVELESVVLQAERERRSHEEERQHQAQLLELRAARIRQLEGQLREVAYGARWLPAPPAANAGADAGAAPAPCGGEVLLELHVAGAALSAEALGHLGDAQPLTFCTYGIYDFETHCTPLALGPRPRYGFTSQYVARDEPLFLRYLRRSAARLELHWAAAAEHGTLASCWLRFSEALGHGRRVPATAALRGPSGESFGVLEYWTRLQLPAEHRNASGCSSEEEVLEAEGLRNELRVQVTGCAGLRARRLGAWPSPYAIYRFFAFPDHATLVVPGSGEPRFGDLRAFPLRVTAELHRYLRLGRLRVYVFDDEDDEEPGAYLGKAEVPLLPLARGRSVTGDFALADPHGNPNGTINLSLEWQHRYAPPAPDDRSARRHRAAAARRAPGSLPRHDSPPVPESLPEDAASLERESASEAPSTDSDEIVVGSSPWKPAPVSAVRLLGPRRARAMLPPLSPSPPQASERIRVEVVSLRLHAGTPAHGSAGCLRQLYVEYHFPGVPPAETETPLALREPRGSEELFFHSSRVIRLDGEVGKARRELLFAMLRDKELGCSRLRFTVVSEPVAGAPGGECQELGTAWLDLAEILRTGRDALERDLDVCSPAEPGVAIGQLRVSVEAADALRAVYRRGRQAECRGGPLPP